MGEEWSRHVLSLVPRKRSPSPDLLDGRHHLLDVILGPAPGLSPHGPAGHAGGLGPRPSPQLDRLPSGRLRLGARPGSLSLGLPSLQELAAPSLAPQLLRKSPPRFLPPRPAPARPGAARRRGQPEPRPARRPAPPRPARARPLGAPGRAAPPARCRE